MTIDTRWLLGLVLAVSGSAFAGDWAHWRGPTQDGICYEKNLVGEFAVQPAKNVLWVSEIGGRATPVVMNDRVYLNCKTHHNAADPTERIDARQQVVCWDAATGAVLWKDVFNVAQTDIPHPRVGWASMVGDPETGYVYCNTVDGHIRCYTADGELVWNHETFEEYGLIAGYGGRTHTPIVDEDRLIVSFLAANWGETKGPAPKHFYYAFDKKDGTLLWTSAPGGPPADTNYSCPIIRVIEGTRMLIGGGADGGIHAINARTGEPLWSFRMSRRGINASPVVEGNHVFITHGEDNIDTNAFGRVTCVDATMRGDITPTENVPGKSAGQVWRVNNVKAGYASPLVKDGILYVVDDGANMHAYDSQTGEELWTHNLGTVGKGSPVWADGKIYVMEVNGNIHVLETDREGVKTINHIADLPSPNPQHGVDEIYASPAISEGRIFLCTRDRLICVGDPDREVETASIPELDEETAPQDEIATIHLVPYETYARAGESIDYTLRAFDANGRFLKTLEPELSVAEGLDGATTEGASLKTGGVKQNVAGTLVAKHGDLEAKARLRVFTPLPWEWGFEGFEGLGVPETWVRAAYKIKPQELDGEPVMFNEEGRGRPSVYIWMGPPDMQDYVIAADFRFEGRRKLSYGGVTNQKYNLIAKANTNKLEIQSWAPHLRMAAVTSYRFEPGQWYRLKFDVDVEDGKAICRGKIWERGEEEPEEWTITGEDPHPNEAGSPGLYFYSLAESYCDNVSVTEDK